MEDVCTYIAKKQLAKYVVLPVYTQEGNKKFTSILFQQKYLEGDIKWDDFAKLWNWFADGKSIFHKVTEHLKSYYNHWKDQRTLIDIEESTKRLLTERKIAYIILIPISVPKPLSPHPTHLDLNAPAAIITDSDVLAISTATADVIMETTATELRQTTSTSTADPMIVDQQQFMPIARLQQHSQAIIDHVSSIEEMVIVISSLYPSIIQEML